MSISTLDSRATRLAAEASDRFCDQRAFAELSLERHFLAAAAACNVSARFDRQTVGDVLLEGLEMMGADQRLALMQLLCDAAFRDPAQIKARAQAIVRGMAKEYARAGAEVD